MPKVPEEQRALRPSTPLVGSTPRSRTQRILSIFSWRQQPAALIVFGFGFALAIGAFLLVQARERQASRIAFERRASRTVTSLLANLDRPLEVLRTLPALFEASKEVTRAEFKIFVSAALARHPDIMALAWMPRVRAPERMAFEDAARRDGLPGFEFTELQGERWVRAGDRPEYFPIFYVEPTFPRFMGYDESSEPGRAEAMARARDSGAPAASRKLVLLSSDRQRVAGVIVFMPIYAQGSVPPSVEARRALLRGFVVQVFRFEAVFAGVSKVEDLRGLELKLFDHTEPARPELLHQIGGVADAASFDLATTTEILPFATRRWSLAVTGPATVSAAPFAVLGAGLVLSLLLAASTVALTTALRLRRSMQAALKLGPFTLVEKLGEGGMGVVYKATHAMLKRPTAVKLVRVGQEDEAMLRRFEREVQLTSSLAHPNTIAVYDYDRTREGIFYYAMEYIDGITLEQLVERKGALPPARVTHILKQVAGALAEAHSIGLIHRDIKPANIMISRRGGLPDFVKVLDFGLVRTITNDSASSVVTQATAIVGTPMYLAPEAIAHSSAIDGRLDLYALGAVAYFLLTGGTLFRARTAVEICGHHLHTVPPPPSARAEQSVPAAIDALVMRCLEKRPEQRFASASALLVALSALTEIGVWSDADAEAWWTDHGDALVLALRAESSARVSQPLAVGGR